MSYDRIVDFEPYSDGFGIMPDAQTARPQAFKTGDGWFAYNLAVSLYQMKKAKTTISATGQTSRPVASKPEK